MATLITDLELQQQLQAQRREAQADRFDEVWEGTHVMNPMPNIEHQVLATQLSAIFHQHLGRAKGTLICAGVNVSDRKTDWKQNYRCPDVAVYLADTKAENCDTFWYGGPDFAVEIISPGDRSREKLEFYASIGTRELLIVDRYPWQLELYRLADGQLRPAAISSVPKAEIVESAVIPFTFGLADGKPRPAIEVTHTESDKKWRV